MTSIDEIIANLDHKQFIEDWNRVSFKEIKKKFGLYRELAIKVAKSLGLKEKITQLDIHTDYGFDTAEFEKDWNSGMSLVDLAKKHHFSYPEKAKRFAKKIGLQKIQRNSLLKILPRVNALEFTDDWNYGMSLVDLKQKYDLAYPDQAKKIAQNLHLPAKRPSQSTRFQNVDIKKFTEMYLDKNFKVRQIQKEFSFADAGYVSRLAKELGLPLRMSFTDASHESKFSLKKELFKEMWISGKSLKQISNQLSVSLPSLISWRKKLDLPKRGPFGRSSNYRASVINEIMMTLLSHNGAMSTSELYGILKHDKNTIRTLLKSNTFDSIDLTAGHSSTSKLKTSHIFGDDTNKRIIFFRGKYAPLLLKLSEIISKSTSGLNEKNVRKKISFTLRRIFSQNEELLLLIPHLENLIKYQKLRDKLRGRITGDLDSLRSELHMQTDTLETNKSKPVELDEILEKLLAFSKSTIFFGRVFHKNDFLKKLDSNFDLQENLNLLKQIFSTVALSIEDAPASSFYHFKIVSDSTFYVRVMVHQLISKVDLDILFSNIRNDKGIIITLQEVDNELLDAYPNKIAIITREKLEMILTHIKFIPSQIGDIGKIMYGEGKDHIVLVQDINYYNNTANAIELLERTPVTIKLGSINVIYQSEEISNNLESELIPFLKKIYEISSPDGMTNLGIVSNIQILDKVRYDEETIRAKIGDNLVSIKFPEENRYVGNLDYPRGIDYCRNYLISCNCLAWLDQLDNAKICKHIVNLIFYLWNKQLEELKIKMKKC